MRTIDVGLNRRSNPLASAEMIGTNAETSRAVAERAVQMFDEHIREPLRARGLPDDEHAQALVDAFRALLPTVTTIVTHHFPLSRYREAFLTQHDKGKHAAVKAMFTFDG